MTKRLACLRNWWYQELVGEGSAFWAGVRGNYAKKALSTGYDPSS